MRFNLLVRGQKRLNPNRSNSDLWAWVLQSVEILGQDAVQFLKVPGHRTLQSARTFEEAWMFFHNDYADRAARAANEARPAAFWDIWERHVAATCAATKLSDQIRAVHLAVGKRQVQADQSEVPVDQPIQVRQRREFVPLFALGQWRGAMLPKFARLYGHTVHQKIVRWFLARLTGDQGGEPIWISFVQLYIDFQLAWGHPGPLRIQNQWVDIDSRSYLTAEAHPFRQRVRWFRQCMKAFFTEAAITVGLEQCRPRSETIQAFMPSASLPWDLRALAEVERWLTEQLTAPCVRSASALCSLPPAARCRGMQV